MAITTINQWRCLRRNFIISRKRIVEAAKLSRKRGEKSQIPTSKTQGNPKLQYSNQSRAITLGFSWLESVWNLYLGIWDFFSHIVGCFSNHFPNIAEMFLSRKNISQSDPHDCSSPQFSLGKISATGSIDALDNLTVDDVDLFIVTAADFATETNDAHHNRRRQFEALVFLNPIRKEFGQA